MTLHSFKRYAKSAWPLLAMALLLLPNLVWAQSAGPYTVSNDDLSKKIFIDYLFGPLNGAGVSPLTNVVKIFNSAVLFLGGVFMAYTIIAGTMATAHDGEMLGKKWSSLWLPIRTTLGAAAVMPVIGGGWCAAQAIVVWLATLGIGIANVMWTSYAKDPLSDAIYTPPAMAQQIHDVFGSMLMNTVCVAAYRQSNADDISDGAAVLANDGNANTFGVYVDTYNGSGYSYGTKEEASSAHATCGKIGLHMAVQGDGNKDTGGGAGAYVSMTGSSLVDMNAVATAIFPTQTAKIVAAQQELSTLSVKIVNKQATQADVNSTLDKVTADYVTAVNAAAISAYQQARNVNYQQQMEKDGWLMAGAFYMSISRAQDALTNAVTSLPSVSSPWDKSIGVDSKNNLSPWESFRNWASSLFSSVGPPSALVKDSMGRAWMMVKASQRASAGGVQFATEEAGDETSGSSFTNRFLGAFTSSMNGVDDALEAGSGYNQNPIIMAKNLGNSMVNWAWSAFGIAAALGGVATLAAGAGGGAFMMMAGPFTALFSILLVSGASMAYYLPMLPYILWIGVVFGWMILLVEAVIAAPLWAVVHMAPDADGVVGRGGQGYMLVLSLTLRPALMVFGLIAAISLMRPIGYLINSTFAGAFLLSQGPGGGALTGTVAGCAIYAGMMITIINRVFSLIHVVPDRLLRWIGGGGNELGGEAGELERGSGAKLLAATQAAKGLAEQGQSTLGRAGQMRAEAGAREAAQRGAEQQEIGNLQDRGARAEMASSKAASMAKIAPEEDRASAYAQSEVQGQNAMAAGLQNSVRQAQIMARHGGKDNHGRSTPDSVAASKKAQEFVQAYNSAKESGQPGWEESFIATQAAQAAKTSASQRSPYEESIVIANVAQGRVQEARAGMAKVAQERAVAAEGTSGVRDVPPPSPSQVENEENERDNDI